MPSLSDYTNYTDNQAVEPAIDPNITRIVVRPQQKEPDVKEPEDSTVKHIFDKLFGLNGEERYQLWPEKVVREGLSAAHDTMTGDIPQYSIDENTGDVHTSPQMIKAGVDMSSLAGTGGLAGVGNEAGTALGATPFLRPALKYGEKLYKGKEGAQHVDLIPEDLYPTFQKQAMNGEDISHWNFGFHNDKGHFLDREKALQYGIDNGIIDPQAGKFGALTSTMMADSSKPGVAIEATAQAQKPFYSAVENAVAGAKQPTADAAQWLGYLKNQPGVKQEELQHLGLDKLQGPISKDDLLKAVQEGQPQIKEVVKGIVPDDFKHPVLDSELGNWSREFEHKNDRLPNQNELAQARSDLIKNLDLGDTSNPTKYHSYQLPGGENYREMLLTLPDKHAQHIKNIDKQFEDVNTELRILSNKNQQNTPEYEALSKQYNDLYKQRKEAYEKTGTAYQSSHWDEPNVLAHIRMNDRTIDGKKSLHLEEIQSDWHQAGRKQGYKDNDKINSLQKEIDDINKNFKPLKKLPEGYDLIKDGDKWVITPPGQIHARPFAGQWPNKEAAIKSALDKINETNLIKSRDEINSKLIEAKAGIPDAPFKKTWDELALKKAITEAVKGGYDQISWTPGEAQAARYDLSKQVDKITIPMVNENGTRSVRIDAKSQSPFKLMVNKDGIVEGHGGSSSQFSGKPLSDVVGKEMADKIMKLEKPDEFSGDGLKIGGQGMKSFYDKMLVDKMNAIGKKFGNSKVSKSEIATKKNNIRKSVDDRYSIVGDGRMFNSREEALKAASQPVHTFPITPELRNQVLTKGLPLFSMGLPIYTPVNHNPFKDIDNE